MTACRALVRAFVRVWDAIAGAVRLLAQAFARRWDAYVSWVVAGRIRRHVLTAGVSVVADRLARRRGSA